MSTYKLTGLAIILAASGCFYDPSSTNNGNGNNGNGVSLLYPDGGDLATHPIAAGGARTTIEVIGTQIDEVRSSDPTVAMFTVDGGQTVDVVSGVAGATTIQVFLGGKLMATNSVIVVDTSSLGIVSQGWLGNAPTLVAGASEVLHVTTVGADGNSTRGDGAVHFQLVGDLAAAVVPVDGDAIGFSGALPAGVTSGTGTIIASCPATQLSVLVNVVDPSLVNDLVVDSPPTTSSDGSASVAIAAQLADGSSVYSDPCVWSVSDSSVTLADEISGLDVGAGTLTIFNLTRTGTFTATCTMAGLSRTVTLQR
ncbi:MAG TPA: hypothetical protein VIA18_07700 [Polyangia bacterium]|jgi:hypothetical protein|nr:hypothetical protein [Polyangia bacterium]